MSSGSPTAGRSIGPASLSALRDFLAPVVNVPEEEFRLLAGLLREVALEKGQFMTQAGERPTDFGLVLSGLVRKFYVTQEGRQVTRGFATLRELVGAYAALLSGVESRLSVQALEPSLLLAIDFGQFQSLYPQHTCWNTLGRRTAEMLFIEREQRETELLTLGAPPIRWTLELRGLSRSRLVHKFQLEFDWT